MQVPLLASSAALQLRCLNLHEYQSKELMSRYQINTQKFKVAKTADEAAKAATELGACGRGRASGLCARWRRLHCIAGL